MFHFHIGNTNKKIGQIFIQKVNDNKRKSPLANFFYNMNDKSESFYRNFNISHKHENFYREKKNI